MHERPSICLNGTSFNKSTRILVSKRFKSHFIRQLLQLEASDTNMRWHKLNLRDN